MWNKKVSKKGGRGKKRSEIYFIFIVYYLFITWYIVVVVVVVWHRFQPLEMLCLWLVCSFIYIFEIYTMQISWLYLCVFVDEYILSNRKSTTIVASTCLRFICWMLVTFDGTKQIQKIFQCWERVSIYIFVSHLFSSNFVWIDISTTEFIQFKLTLPRFIAWTLATRIHIVLTSVCLCSFECCWNVVNAHIWFAHSSKKKLTITYIMERETPSNQQRIHHIYNK